MRYTKTVIVSSTVQLSKALTIGQWVWFTANSNIPAEYRNKRGQWLGFDQFGFPVVNLSPAPKTTLHKNNNWKAQFKSNAGLRQFTKQRNEV